MMTTAGSFERALDQFRIDDLDLLINVKRHRHLGLKLRIPALHVVTDLVPTNLALPQNPVQPGPAQLGQARVTNVKAVLPHMLLTQ
jgi:hypothetical protein